MPEVQNRNVATAVRFAEALDAEDYGALDALLAQDCEYAGRDDTRRGPEAIAQSYRSAGMWAKTHIASVVYESRVRPEAGGSVVVTFVDHLHHGGMRHTYSCEQRLEFAPDGAIRSITHLELPGERGALDAFLAKAGLRR